MSIYVIGDLHVSFSQNKPMNIFGDNWENHEEKIKQNWEKKVTDNDYVIIAGDFSWATYLKDTMKDFDYLNKLPGKKILLKGNHDYWWTTITSMKKFLKENNFNNIDFLYNNSFCIEDVIIVGTRGWNIGECESNDKMIKRESNRLELSIVDGIKKYGTHKDIISFLHYPPLNSNLLEKNKSNELIDVLNKYTVKKCYYGHLHGLSHKDAIIGIINGIEYNLISADYLNFDLIKIV